jgi:hypothetical protein
LKTLLHPTYFPNITSFAILAQNVVLWEVEDNFQKQTYRNRTHICTDRGKLMLNIPIQHVGKNQGRQKYKDVKIDTNENWQRQHWRTLQTAYRTSPFFEYYEDDIATLFEQKSYFLLDFNLKTIEVVCECLQIEMPCSKAEVYSLQHENDKRFLVNAKSEVKLPLAHYNQVFGERHGFLKNMSVLDLLFNEGTSALTYLKNIDLNLLND